MVQLLHAAPPEGALRLVAPAEGQHHGQADLALAKIVSDGLAEFGLARRIVQNVVDQLECDPEVPAIGLQGPLLALRPLGHHGADPAGGGEERRGLGADHFQAVVHGGLGVVRGHELPHLALGDDGRGVGQDLQDLERAVGHHDLKGAAEQEVADQHARFVAPDGVGGDQPPAQIALVDHVVVEKGRGVDELDAGRERQVAPAPVAAEAGRGERQHGAQPLAAGGDDVPGELRNQENVGAHVLQDDGVDRLQIRPGKRGERFEPALPDALPLLSRSGEQCQISTPCDRLPRSGYHIGDPEGTG